MSSTDITKATIWEDGDVVEMAQVQVDGTDILITDVSTISRKIFNTSADTAGAAVSLLPINTIYDTLQLGQGWTKNTTGFNFRDRIPGANFPTGGDTYRVEYSFVGDAGEVFFLVFEHDANEIQTS